MRSYNTTKLAKAIQDLEAAYKRRHQAEDHLVYAGIAKCFEVCLEYAWKYLKLVLEEQGLEAYAPKDVIRTAGRMGLIDNVEDWLQFINVRNFAVHDYLGVSPEEYLSIIGAFISEVAKLDVEQYS